jgi:NAD(P)-dependent dehydrogenase (short-subunit alcohol dehydrogenase family)
MTLRNDSAESAFAQGSSSEKIYMHVAYTPDGIGNFLWWEYAMRLLHMQGRGKMNGRLAGKVALVMGAGSVGDIPAQDGSIAGWGNGKAAAVLYAREGAKVYAVDIRQEAVQDTKAIIDREGGVCLPDQSDATKSDQVKAVTDGCLAAFGRIDILHNNVGGSSPGGPVEMSEEAWDANIDLNLKSAFLTCKHVLPVMERQGYGVIINISSLSGLRCGVGRHMVSYHASKAGLIQFTRSVAIQYAKKGIRANCVVPGMMETPLVINRVAPQFGGGDVQGTIERRHAACPTGKMGDAWDVAYAALFLASDEAKYVTATHIVVDGGLSAT